MPALFYLPTRFCTTCPTIRRAVPPIGLVTTQPRPLFWNIHFRYHDCRSEEIKKKQITTTYYLKTNTKSIEPKKYRNFSNYVYIEKQRVNYIPLDWDMKCTNYETKWSHLLLCQFNNYFFFITLCVISNKIFETCFTLFQLPISAHVLMSSKILIVILNYCKPKVSTVS